MVLERKSPLGEFRARMRQVEPGLYRAEYSGEINPENPDEREIPDYHLSTSIADAKVWVEQMARGLGYEHVVWDELPEE
jgi:hypothetical protein